MRLIQKSKVFAEELRNNNFGYTYQEAHRPFCDYWEDEICVHCTEADVEVVGHPLCNLLIKDCRNMSEQNVGN